MTAVLQRLLLIANGLGLLLYLYWLGTRSERLFHTVDGALQLLPCLLFLFVFIYLRPRPAAKDPEEND